MPSATSTWACCLLPAGAPHTGACQATEWNVCARAAARRGVGTDLLTRTFTCGDLGRSDESRAFAGALAEAYRSVKALGSAFEVVLVSSDRNVDDFAKFLGALPVGCVRTATQV